MFDDSIYDLQKKELVSSDQSNFINLRYGYNYNKVGLTTYKIKTMKDDVLNKFKRILIPQDFHPFMKGISRLP